MLFDTIFEKRGRQVVPTMASPLLGLLGSNKKSKTGIDIDEEEALSSTAVWSAVTQLSQAVASLPLHLYKRLKGGGKERYTKDALYNMMHLQPNPEMTSFAFREAQMSQLLMIGTSFAEIVRDQMNRIVELWPLLTSRMTTLRSKEGGNLFYRYDLSDGTNQLFKPEQILRVNGYSQSGLLGYKPIEKNREAIALNLAYEEYAARYFGDGARPPAVLEHPEHVGPEGHDNIRGSFEKMHAGLSNSQRIVILEEGMKLHEFGFSVRDSQVPELRRFQIAEVCRIFNIPPHFLHELDKATFNNIEELSRGFVKFSLRYWLVRLEQAYNTQLLNAKQQSKYFYEHTLEGLLRADQKARYEAYQIAVANGWLNANEIRKLENMNPQPGGQGELYFVPLNWIPKQNADKEPEIPAREPPDEIVDTDEEEASVLNYWQTIAPKEDRAKLNIDHKMVHGLVNIERIHYKSIKSTMQQVISRECNAVRKALKNYLDKEGSNTSPVAIEKRNIPEFLNWLEGFYADHKRYVKGKFDPIMTTYLEAIHQESSKILGAAPNLTPELEEFINGFLERFAYEHCRKSEGQIKALLDVYASDPKLMRAEDPNIFKAPAADVNNRLDEWLEKRADKVAMDESVRGSNAMARETWRSSGITKIKWVAVGKNCPFCTRMNGRTIEIKKNFLDAGNVIYAGPNASDFDISDPVKGEYVHKESPRVKQPTEKWGALKVRGNKAHPPIHRG